MGCKAKNLIQSLIEIILIIVLFMNISVNIIRIIDSRILMNRSEVLLEELKMLKED